MGRSCVLLLLDKARSSGLFGGSLMMGLEALFHFHGDGDYGCHS